MLDYHSITAGKGGPNTVERSQGVVGAHSQPVILCIVSSTFISTVDISSSLTMSENFQNPSLLGTANSLQLSIPTLGTATSLPGSICDFSRVSAPTVSSAWLLPSAAATSFQPLMGSAYLCQHSNTTLLSGVPGQSQSSTSAASYSGISEWNITGRTAKKSSSLEDFTVTVIDQDTGVSSMAMTAQYNKTSGTNTMVPLYPSLNQGTATQIPNQGNCLSLPYGEGSQVYYYNQGTAGQVLSGELGPCLQSYGPVTYMGSVASAPQPEMVMVLKRIQPTDAPPPASTSGIYYNVPAQPITGTSFQVIENSLGMETSLGFQPLSQTFCLPQTAEFPKSCSIRNIQILESDPPTELGNISITPLQSPTNLLALSPAPSQEQIENINLDGIKTKLSKPLDTFQDPAENQDFPVLPLEIPDIYHLLACTDARICEEEQPGPTNVNLEKNNFSLDDQGLLEDGSEASNGFADITTLVEEICLPQIFSSLEDLDQPNGPKAINATDTGDIQGTQVQDSSNDIKCLSEEVRMNKHEATEAISGAPQIQPKDPEIPLEGEVVACRAAASDRDPANVTQQPNSKPQKAASSRSRISKGHGQDKTKRTKENDPKKAEESKQSGSKVKAENKPSVPKTKRKRNPPELTQESFKKPRSCLGMHMLESVQVFHALGKKSDKKTGLSSYRNLGNPSNIKDRCASSALKPLLKTPQQGTGPEKAQVSAQKLDGEADKGYASPSVYDLPPPGKVKLIPLPFPNVSKPQPRPVPRRPQSLASHRPTLGNPARPASTNQAQPTTVNPPQPAPANTASIDPARPARPISTRPGWMHPTRPSIPPSAVSRPAPNKSSYTSLKWEPVSAAVAKLQSPPNPQNPFLIQDFSRQPIPWRKPDILGPVVSNPITEEQRPEREAMKRRAQQQRENAAKYTSMGKLQFFIEREKEMAISRYYGYAM
ncbi:uncharacterized protein C2orf78-like [Lepus europaeus]|uniref:uncharacterized protein C2orf78-like n=1 Tax=Lepus europaeus TaxID=9983 RepID=UPI002B49B43C|nr:uncharacterized protein C2orf78-like [Lepus europaeus]